MTKIISKFSFIIFVIGIISINSCSETEFISHSKIPSSIKYESSISLPFEPDKICYCAHSESFLLLNKKKNTIFRINKKGKILEKIGEFGFEKGQFLNISDISTDGIGNLFVVDKSANSIIKFDEFGKYLNKISFEEINQPELISVKNNGDLLLYDAFYNEIFCFDNQNEMRYNFGKFSLINPQKIENSTNINYVFDNAENSIFVFDDFGGIVRKIQHDEKIVDIASSKYFLLYITLDGNVFCHKFKSNLMRHLAKISDLFPIYKIDSIFAFDKKVGLISEKKLHLFYLTNE